MASPDVLQLFIDLSSNHRHWFETSAYALPGASENPAQATEQGCSAMSMLMCTSGQVVLGYLHCIIRGDNLPAPGHALRVLGHEEKAVSPQKSMFLLRRSLPWGSC